MQVTPPAGQICNEGKCRQPAVKFLINEKTSSYEVNSQVYCASGNIHILGLLTLIEAWSNIYVGLASPPKQLGWSSQVYRIIPSREEMVEKEVVPIFMFARSMEASSSPPKRPLSFSPCHTYTAGLHHIEMLSHQTMISKLTWISRDVNMIWHMWH